MRLLLSLFRSSSFKKHILLHWLLAFSLLFSSFLAESKTIATQELMELDFKSLLSLQTNIGSTIPSSIADAPASITIFNERDIARTGTYRLVDLLNFVPGINTVSTEDGAATYFYIRGGDKASNILLLIDGRPVNDYFSNSWLRQYANYPTDNIEKMEVLRGASSAVYGTNAVNAVINIFTKKGVNRAKIKIGRHGGKAISITGTQEISDVNFNIAANYRQDQGESYHRVQTFDPRWDVKDSNPNDSLIDEIKDSQDYANFQLDADYKNLLFGFSFTSNKTEDYYSVDAFVDSDIIRAQWAQMRWYLDYKQSLLENLEISAKYRGRQNKRESNFFMVLTNENNPDGYGFYAFGPAGAISSVAKIEALYPAPDGFPADIYNREKVETLIHNLIVQLDWRKNEKFSMTSGIEFETGKLLQNKIKSNFNPYTLEYLPSFQEVLINSRFLRKSADSDTLRALYIDSKYQPNEQWTVYLGGRWDNGSDFGTEFNPRLGISWKPSNKDVFKLMYNEAFRIQNRTIFNIFSSASATAKRNIISHKSYELSWLAERLAWQSELSIYYRKTGGNLRSFGDGDELLLVISDKESTLGIESSFQIPLTDNTHLSASLSYLLDHDDKLKSDRANGSPSKLSGSLGISTKFNKLTLNVAGYYHQSTQHRERFVATEGDYPSIKYANINAQYKFSDKVAFTGGITNVFDRKIDLFERVDNSNNQRWYPLRGRNAFVGVELKF